MKTGSFARADKLMAAGLSALTCGFLVLVAPRVAILFLEIVVGLSLVTWAFLLRRHLRRARALPFDLLERGLAQAGSRSTEGPVCLLDRYGLALIALVIVICSAISGFLRPRGFSEGLVRILPLLLFSIGLLAKPRVLRWLTGKKADREGQEQEVEAHTGSKEPTQAEPATFERRYS